MNAHTYAIIVDGNAVGPFQTEAEAHAFAAEYVGSPYTVEFSDPPDEGRGVGPDRYPRNPR